uniref:DUF2922 domain-containing protein n=1 Tax=Mesocestoides corti TaxID=53468 RepID=A0A5K3FRM7_MESCO
MLLLKPTITVKSVLWRTLTVDSIPTSHELSLLKDVLTANVLANPTAFCRSVTVNSAPVHASVTPNDIVQTNYNA